MRKVEKIQLSEKWVEGLSSRFAESICANAGTFDADLEVEPPFVTNIPSDDPRHCFTFTSLGVLAYSAEECERKLKRGILKYIRKELGGWGRRRKKKAVIVWRAKPFVEGWFDLEKGCMVYRGCTRLAVLHKNSKEVNYFDMVCTR